MKLTSNNTYGLSSVGASSSTLGSLNGLYLAFNARNAGTATQAQEGLLNATPLINGSVVVDIVSATGNGADILEELVALGLQNASTFRGYVSGLLPVDAIPALANVANVQYADASLLRANVGQVENEAVTTINVDDARTEFGVDGSGVTVGVLSDSFDALGIEGADFAADIANGELPDDVLIIEDFAGGSDEGRAIAQLIADIAPGSDLQFATAFTGIAGFANNIIALREAGSDIIIDDVIFFAEPRYSDGIIAQAVDAVVNDGAIFFSSVGNTGELGYDSEFRISDSSIDIDGNGTLDGFLHDFDPGEGVDFTQLITIAPSATVTFSVQWDDPFFGDTGGNANPDADIDVILRFTENNPFGAAAGAIAFVSGGDNIATGTPVELFTITNPTTEALELDLSFLLFSEAETAPTQIGYTLFSSPTVATIEEFNTFGPTAFGHSVASGSIAVGASAAPFNSAEAFEEALGVDPELFGFDVPAINFFSSTGPREIFFDADGNRLDVPDLRPGPQISATDGVSTSVPGFGTFFGTSAAAPNAAAVIALAKELFPDLDRTVALTALEETAIDINARFGALFGLPQFEEILPEGTDFESGAGLIQADAALAFINDLTSVSGDLEVGTNGDDFISGSSRNDALFGGIGNDRILGGSRDDQLFGNEDSDTLNGGSGNDFLSGGAEDDRLFGDSGNDTLRGATGNDNLQGGSGHDAIDGGIQNDTIRGGSGNDTINGGADNDVINGDSGNDVIDGGTGDDEITGGSGRDTIFGNSGSDTLSGGSGRDVFSFAPGSAGDTDTITDFNRFVDRIDLDGFDFSSVDEVLAAATEVGSDVILALDAVTNQTLRILRTDLDDLSASNISLGGEDSEAGILAASVAATSSSTGATSSFANTNSFGFAFDEFFIGGTDMLFV